MSTNPQLVHVASYLSAAEADAAQMRLAMDEIPAWLSNSGFVSWFWHYSNATGGVKLFVSEYYAPHAIAALSRDVRVSETDSTTWKCPHCAAEVAGSWQYCWSCGTSKAGEEDPDFHRWYQIATHRRRQAVSREQLALFVSIGTILVVIGSHGAVGPLLAWAILVLLLGPLVGRSYDDREPFVEPPPDQMELEDVGRELDSADSPDRVVVRMWAASVFGILWSLLFLLPAIYYGLTARRLANAFRPIDRCRYRIACGCLALCILWSVAMICLVAFFFKPAAWLLGVVSSFASLLRPPLR